MHNAIDQPSDFGTGQKTLKIYLIGLVFCVALTLIAFYVAMNPSSSLPITIAVIYLAATAQFFIQVICFLRLNFKTRQGKINIAAFAYTGLILLCILAGSLWIMFNLHYNMLR